MQRNTSDLGLSTIDNEPFQSSPVQYNETDLDQVQKTEKRPLLQKLSSFFTEAPKTIKEKHNKIIENLRNKLIIITVAPKQGIPITHEPSPLIHIDTEHQQQLNQQGSLDIVSDDMQLSIDPINNDPTPEEQQIVVVPNEEQEQDANPIEFQEELANQQDEQRSVENQDLKRNDEEVIDREQEIDFNDRQVEMDYSQDTNSQFQQTNLIDGQNTYRTFDNKPFHSTLVQQNVTVQQFSKDEEEINLMQQTEKRPLLSKLSGFFTGAPQSIKEKHDKVIENLRNKLIIITLASKKAIPITHEPTSLLQVNSEQEQQLNQQGSLDIVTDEIQLPIDPINYDPSTGDQQLVVVQNEEYEQHANPIEVQQNREDQQELANQQDDQGSVENQVENRNDNKVIDSQVEMDYDDRQAEIDSQDANSQYQQTNLVDGQHLYQNDEDNNDDIEQENASHHQEQQMNQSSVKNMEESERDAYVTQQDEQNEFIDASKMERDMTNNQSLEGAEIYQMLNQDTIVSRHQESKIQDHLHERELILAEYQQLNKEIQNLSEERKKFIKIQKKPFKVDYKRLVDISDDNEAIYRAKDLVRKMNAQRREKQQRERRENERIDRYFASELIAEDNHRKLSYEQVKKLQIQERIDKYHQKQEEFQQLQQISHNFVKNLMQIGPQNGKLAQEVELRAQKVKGSNRMVKIDRLVVHLPRLKNLQQRKFENEQVILSYQDQMIKNYEQSKRSLFKK